MAQSLEVDVHIVACPGFKCRCKHLAHVICEDLKKSGLHVALGYECYPIEGPMVDHRLDFTKRSRLTIVTVCNSKAATLRDFINEINVHLAKRLCFVLAENIRENLDFLDRFIPIQLQNPAETETLRNFLNKIVYGIRHEQVTHPSNDCKNVSIKAKPVECENLTEASSTTYTSYSSADYPDPIPENPVYAQLNSRKPRQQRRTRREQVTHPSNDWKNVSIKVKPFGFENLTEASSSINTWSSPQDSRFAPLNPPQRTVSSEEADTVNLDEYVELPSLKPLSFSGGNNGPVVKRRYTHIPSPKQSELEEEFKANRLHLVVDSGNGGEISTTPVLFVTQKLSGACTDVTLSELAHLLKCNDELIVNKAFYHLRKRLFKPISFDLERPRVLMDFESTEKVLFMCFKLGHLSNNILDLACLYLLCCAHLLSYYSNTKDETSMQKSREIRSKAERSFLSDQYPHLNICFDGIRKLLSPEQYSYIVHFCTDLFQYVSRRSDKAVPKLRNLLRLKRPRISFLQKSPKPHVEGLRRLCFVKGLVTALLGDSLDDSLYVLQMLKFLEIAKLSQNPKGPWLEHIDDEIHLLLFVKRTDTSLFRTTGIIRDGEMFDRSARKQISGMFAPIGLRTINRSTRTSNWRQYKTTLGKADSESSPSLVSVTYRIPTYGEITAQGLSHEDRDMIASCETEQKCLMYLQGSAFIVELVAWNFSLGLHVIVVEQPSSVTLQEYFRSIREQGLNIQGDKMRELAVNVITAVEFCHYKKIRHQDIRADNFYYIRETGQLRLYNFRNARPIDKERQDSSTMTEFQTQFLSTLWASPESLRRGPTTEKSDIWSLGLTLIEVFTHGCWPYSLWLRQYPYEDVVLWIESHAIQPVIDLECIPQEARPFILNCLTTDPDSRPSAESLLEDFTVYHETDLRNAGKWEFLSRVEYPSLCEYQFHKNWKADKGLSFKSRSRKVPSLNVLDLYRQELLRDFKDKSHDKPAFLFDLNCVHIKESIARETKELQNAVILPDLNKSALRLELKSGTPSTLITTCPGQNLKTLRSFLILEKVSGEFLLEILFNIIESLEVLHKKNIIHRDIRASNILIDEDTKECYLYRFARMKNVHRPSHEFQEESRHLSHGNATAAWYPLEVLQEQTYTKETDIFMFGMTVWETFWLIDHYGTTKAINAPFSGCTVPQLITMRERSHHPLKPNSCPDFLYGLLQRCWRTSPADRPTAFEVKKCIMERNVPTAVTRRYRVGDNNRNKNAISTGFLTLAANTAESIKRPASQLLNKRTHRTTAKVEQSFLNRNMPTWIASKTARSLGNLPTPSLYNTRTNFDDTSLEDGFYTISSDDENMTDLKTYMCNESLTNPKIYASDESLTNPKTYLGDENLTNPKTFRGDESLTNPKTYASDENLTNPKTLRGDESLTNPKIYASDESLTNAKIYLGDESLTNPKTFRGDESLTNPKSFGGDESVMDTKRLVNTASLKPHVYGNLMVPKRIKNNESASSNKSIPNVTMLTAHAKDRNDSLAALKTSIENSTSSLSDNESLKFFKRIREADTGNIYSKNANEQESSDEEIYEEDYYEEIVPKNDTNVDTHDYLTEAPMHNKPGSYSTVSSNHGSNTTLARNRPSMIKSPKENPEQNMEKEENIYVNCTVDSDSASLYAVVD